ncbi:MAG: protein-glutamine gamma-glutamyltransferase [Bacillus sp. (in: Bacteria)]|nr:protein-glutamine gamma-glutamyltransferase [Bacillus sp. (in: firmicutes)]
MIKINQKLIDVSQINHENLSYEKTKILELMGKYNKIYEYETIEQLEFELSVRLQIIQAAVLLNNSGVQFATYSTSTCNENYWKLEKNGAFVLKPNVLPRTAIEDIFLNGSKYAFECATAMVIIFYKAVLESINKEQFNRLFSGLYLYNWVYDQDLNLRTHEGTDFLPGDCVYFKNPEHDPKTSQWQGENAIILDENLYYGHGIGITTSQIIINFLNTKRKKNSNKSAYLTNHITRLNFDYLSPFRLKIFRESPLIYQQFSNLIISKIGSTTYFL